MADRVTQPTNLSADDVLAAAPTDKRRADAEALLALIREETGAEPVVWGTSMIGFGRQPYTTADGKTRDYFAVGLAARKAALTIYGLTYYGTNDDLLERLGPHTTGKGCLYVKDLAAIDRGVLTTLIQRAWATNHQPEG